ncbi:MAG: hypothetical protein R3214_02225 [Christiangramia sp.]|nr:hypothetical protein [Christiangramia sp.]
MRLISLNPAILRQAHDDTDLPGLKILLKNRKSLGAERRNLTLRQAQDDKNKQITSLRT